MANVVIIDDDPIFRVLLAEHCSLLGHAAEVADSIETGKLLLNLGKTIAAVLAKRRAA